MRQEIHVTGKILRKTASATQEITEVREVLAFDKIEFFLRVYGVEGTSPTVDVTIETSMQNELDDESWKTVATFTAVTTAPTYEIKSVDMGFLRYVRWKVVTTGGAGSLHFWIRGIGRRYA